MFITPGLTLCCNFPVKWNQLLSPSNPYVAYTRPLEGRNVSPNKISEQPGRKKSITAAQMARLWNVLETENPSRAICTCSEWGKCSGSICGSRGFGWLGRSPGATKLEHSKHKFGMPGLICDKLATTLPWGSLVSAPGCSAWITRANGGSWTPVRHNAASNFETVFESWRGNGLRDARPAMAALTAAIAATDPSTEVMLSSTRLVHAIQGSSFRNMMKKQEQRALTHLMNKILPWK